MPKRKIGRPSSYSDATASIICIRIAEGESLRSICADEDMPSKTTVLNWLADKGHSQFLAQYARAREAQADALVEECLEIADEASNDWMERKGPDGQSLGWQLNGEHVQRSKLRVDTRKWWAARLAPKKYGERQQVTGADGGPIQVQDVSNLDLARGVAFVLAQGAAEASEDEPRSVN